MTYTATGLPGGLSINSTNGQITGTPTTATSGAVPVTITVTDSTTPTHQTASTTGLTITIIGQLTITSNPLPNGVVGTPYTASETVNGGTGTLAYSATGLPGGLSINATTGQITGTPTTATPTPAAVTITVTDSTTPTHQTASTTGLMINITTGLTITNNALPNGVVGTAYTASETGSGGTGTLTYSATGLPGGLSINASTGAISGTPTTATGGAVPVTITVTDSTTPTHQTASTTGLTINIIAQLTITSNALPSGVVGTAYTASETVSGGTGTLTYSATGLPGGLSINASTGVISGTPTTAGGPSPVTITVTDGTTPTHQTASTTGLSITITAPQLTITNNPLPSGVVGTVYTASETGSGGTGTLTYSATGLPDGLSINPGSGVISGTPTTATSGAVSVVITVTDSATPTHQTASTTGLTITIAPTPLTITNTALPSGVVGTAYTASETGSGGTAPLTYTATGLPGGLSINSGTGAITGTPTTATGGPVAVTITVTDSTTPTHQTASTTGLNDQHRSHSPDDFEHRPAERRGRDSVLGIGGRQRWHEALHVYGHRSAWRVVD